MIQHFLKVFERLNRATVNGVKAPHKPILLLSIIQSIDSNEILENKIRITPQLVARFKNNWNHLVKDNFFKSNFALPFYHLQSSGFWHLQTCPGQTISLTSSNSIRSFSQLLNAIDFAYLDPELFKLLQLQDTRSIFLKLLSEKYFSNAHLTDDVNTLTNRIAQEILHEPETIYKRQIELADEEEIFVRSGVFKKLIPAMYNETCCISGMSIISSYDIQMVDACHIVPFSVSHNDTISNGLCLSPNLHRAFDRGLIAIDIDYHVVVSYCFTENAEHSGIKQYEGKSIFLPPNISMHPSQENFDWHRRIVFKQ